jgi:myosin light chain 6
MMSVAGHFFEFELHPNIYHCGTERGAGGGESSVCLRESNPWMLLMHVKLRHPLSMFVCDPFLPQSRVPPSQALNIPAIDFAFDVYDFKGDGKVDAYYAGDLLRACNLNPTLKTIEEIGGQKEKGKKVLTKADVFPMYKACKDSKDQGGFHDFVEILKLYDKNNDDTMLGHELFRLLTNLGEKLTKEEAKSLMKELCEPEDDEGFMPFKRKFFFVKG